MIGGGHITGRHVLMMLCAFFGVIVIANFIFIMLAVRTFPGESQRKSYMQGLQYNDVIVERAKQKALGWRAEISRAERAGEGGVIEVRFFDVADNPLGDLTLEGTLKRPAHQGDDKRLVFSASENGAYIAAIDELSAGIWDLSVDATNPMGARFSADARVSFE